MNIDFRFYLSLFLRRLPYFLVFVAIGSAIGLTLATVLPPVYRAEATLLVESAAIDVEGDLNIDPREQLSRIEQQVLTRASIMEMVNRLDVYAPREGEERQRIPADQIVADMRERIQINVTGGSDRRGNTQATVVRVSFTAPSGPLAANVANEVVDLMRATNTEIRGDLTNTNVAFFARRVEELEGDLAEQAERILAFQQANPDALPESLTFRRSQQAAAQERLLGLQRDETRLRDQRDTLVRIFEETGRVDPVEGVRLSPEERQLQDLMSQRDGLLLNLSETHPRVRALDARIAAAQQAVNAQTGTGATDPNEGQLSQFELRLADLDGQLAFISDQQDQIRDELEQLSRSIAATPGNAITLDTLRRDYDNIRVQYDRFVGELAAAQTGEFVETQQAGERISILESAIAPREPNSPNRPVLAAAGIGGGFMLGLAFIVLLELLNTAVRRPVELSNKLGITPLGAIPHIRTRWEIMRRRGIIIGVFAAILIALPLGLWFIHTQITPLDAILNRFLNRLGLPLI